MMHYVTRCLIFFVFIFLFSLPTSANDLIQIRQVLIDGQDSIDSLGSIDGLDNPRQVKLSPDGKTAFVTSADDNALLVLDFDKKLTPSQLFRNDEQHTYKLEGASGLTVFNQGNSVAVASFYDSAISVFHNSQAQQFQFSAAYGNNLDYERVFKSDKPLHKQDTYGLLGAWDAVLSSDEEQLFVASYKSNALSAFDIKNNHQLVFNSKVSADASINLGNPVTLAHSGKNKTVIVAGYTANALSVFSAEGKGAFHLKQRIQDSANGVKDLLNPQKIILSANQDVMYVACSGSNTIVVFELEDQQWVYRQSISHADTGKKGLTGLGSIALSNDGKRFYAAGEMDSGLVIFDVAQDGGLIFNQIFQSDEHRIEGVTSIAISNDGSQLLLTLGKMDALYLLSI